MHAVETTSVTFLSQCRSQSTVDAQYATSGTEDRRCLLLALYVTLNRNVNIHNTFRRLQTVAPDNRLNCSPYVRKPRLESEISLDPIYYIWVGNNIYRSKIIKNPLCAFGSATSGDDAVVAECSVMGERGWGTSSRQFHTFKMLKFGLLAVPLSVCMVRSDRWLLARVQLHSTALRCAPVVNYWV